MSDLMLLGALRAPAPTPDNVLGIAQLVDRARQAADEIERLQSLPDYKELYEGMKIAHEFSEQRIAELEELEKLVSWLKCNDYATGFYCPEEICEAIIERMDDVEKFQDCAALKGDKP